VSWFNVLPILIAAAGLAVGCGGTMPSGDVKEIKETQKQILERLDKLEKGQKDFLAAAQRLAPRPGPQIDYDKVYDIALGNSPVRGAKSGKVTLVEFSDFQCPYSQRAQPLIQQLLDAFPNDLKHVYKNYPLPFHNRAMPAAKACEAAGMQGKFWEMHGLIFENQKSMEDADLKGYAEKIGLNAARFEKDLAGDQAQKLIQEDVDAARQAQVTGTPTLFINGKRVRERTFEAMKKEIEGYLGQQKQGPT
jgi:protein-disulfide isomerase